MGLNLEKTTSVFLDTAPLIYFWEKNIRFYDRVAAFFDEIYAKEIQVTVSLITYIEVVTYPLKVGENKLAAKYRDYLTNSANFSLYPLNLLVADKTAEYRAVHQLRTPDAIQLATAEVCGADYVITNDVQWKKISGLNIVLVSEL
ncbi:MAG: PIN domain-containing protein [Proteobacteria bacterium]|nr:PIN domain-containing protein [Pseudomonadota bacterium]MBU1738189.1 PIN domain-containing protein [Pseudomonadota bacterium]